MPVMVKLELHKHGMAAKIISGYRAGNFICHGMSNAPIIWTDERLARNWLTMTGFTVTDEEYSTMTSDQEIRDLAKHINTTELGTVKLLTDHEGRIEKVYIHAVGVGPFPLDPISAAERMRALVAATGVYYHWPSREFRPAPTDGPKIAIL